MIKYSLKCSEGHRFESWFQSSDAYDRLVEMGQLACAVCNSTKVEKAIMAPQVSSTKGDAKPAVPEAPKPGPLSAPASPAEQMVREFRKKVEANAENVGKDFATEARKIHDGDAPERAIYGEAKLADAKDLIDDGIEVMPLPWSGTRTNS